MGVPALSSVPGTVPCPPCSAISRTPSALSTGPRRGRAGVQLPERGAGLPFCVGLPQAWPLSPSSHCSVRVALKAQPWAPSLAPRPDVSVSHSGSGCPGLEAPQGLGSNRIHTCVFADPPGAWEGSPFRPWAGPSAELPAASPPTACARCVGAGALSRQEGVRGVSVVNSHRRGSGFWSCTWDAARAAVPPAPGGCGLRVSGVGSDFGSSSSSELLSPGRPGCQRSERRPECAVRDSRTRCQGCCFLL